MPALAASVKGPTVIPWLSTRTRSLAERTSLVRSRGPVPAARDDADAGQPWGLRWPVVVEGGRSAGDEVELLPGDDRGAVGDQRLRPPVLSGNDHVVGVRPQGHMPTAGIEQVELFPGSDRGAVGDQGLGASVLRGDVPPVGA